MSKRNKDIIIKSSYIFMDTKFTYTEKFLI